MKLVKKFENWRVYRVSIHDMPIDGHPFIAEGDLLVIDSHDGDSFVVTTIEEAQFVIGPTDPNAGSAWARNWSDDV